MIYETTPVGPTLSPSSASGSLNRFPSFHFGTPTNRRRAVPSLAGEAVGRIRAVELSIRAAMQAPRGGGGFLGKRKEREYYPPYPSASSASSQAVLLQQPPHPFARPDPPRLAVKPDRAAALRLGAKPPLPHAAAAAGAHAAAAAAAGNKLLAGYLAHEFLRCGTLLGERRPEPPGRKEKEPALAVPPPAPSRRYAEVSRLLMAGGARIPGIVNPSQLGRWLRIKE